MAKCYLDYKTSEHINRHLHNRHSYPSARHISLHLTVLCFFFSHDLFYVHTVPDAVPDLFVLASWKNLSWWKSVAGNFLWLKTGTEFAVQSTLLGKSTSVTQAEQVKSTIISLGTKHASDTCINWGYLGKHSWLWECMDGWLDSFLSIWTVFTNY